MGSPFKGQFWGFGLVVFGACLLVLGVVRAAMYQVKDWMDERIVGSATADELNGNISDMKNIAATGVWMSVIFVIIGFIFYMICLFTQYKYGC